MAAPFSLATSARLSTRLLAYAMISTLVVAFAALGIFIAAFWAPEYALVGLLVGSSLGAFIAVHESTLIGCLGGMLVGLIAAPFVYMILDFETSYMVVFIFSLLGAVLGEPLAFFWRETDEDVQGDGEPKA
ncbi:MAG TPA: hypothetical protein PLP29_08495 [Candidatus Ozemobacteraceae bacterium]|nr:hypothetical protein [Candidatus Ozemobacteraceae bacterium]